MSIYAEDLPYLHLDADRPTCDELLGRKSEEGGFLIRQSRSQEGQYILVLYHQQKTYNYRILQTEGVKFYLETTNVSKRSQVFTSIGELVEHYRSLGADNGLKAPLRKGVRGDGTISDSDDSEAELDNDYSDTPYSAIPEAAGHIYSEPYKHLTTVESDQQLKHRLLQKLSHIDSSSISTEFYRSLKNYIEHDMEHDATRPNKDALPRYKHSFLESEMDNLVKELRHFSKKLCVVSQVFSTQSTDSFELSSVDSEPKYKAVTALLSRCKAQLTTTELDVCNCLKSETMYTNNNAILEALENTTSKFTCTTAPGKFLRSSTDVILAVDMKYKKLEIARSNTYKADSYSTDDIYQVIKSTENVRRLQITIKDKKPETIEFQNLQEREHFCQLIYQLMNSDGGCKEELEIYCGTWNMGNSPIPREGGLSSWLRCQGQGVTRKTELSRIPLDLYAIGTQESEISERDWVTRMLEMLQLTFDTKFQMVAVHSNYKMRLVIFVKHDIRPRITHIKSDLVKTGFGGNFGNKGAVAISMNIDGTSICFINSHLCANSENTERRNQNSRDIMQKLNKLTTDKRSDADIVNQFNYVFWVGDLNYRVEDSVERILNQARSAKFNEMLQNDQLSNCIMKEKAFFGFGEADIVFPPTYRYHKGKVDEFNHEKKKPTMIKINAPSWCDRVLWKTYPKSVLSNTSYGVTREVMTSDHKPVFSSFNLRLLPPTITQKVNQIKQYKISINVSNIYVEVNMQPADNSTLHVVIWSNCLDQSAGVCKTPDQVPSKNRKGHKYCQWHETLTVHPQFADVEHLKERHLLLAVMKTVQSGEYTIGESVIALEDVFEGDEQKEFECDLIYLGQNLGTINGELTVDLGGTPGVLEISRKRPKTKIITDIYERPLADFSWEDNSESKPRTLKSIRAQRPKSIIRTCNPGSRPPLYANSLTTVPEQAAPLTESKRMINPHLNITSQPKHPLPIYNYPNPLASQGIDPNYGMLNEASSGATDPTPCRNLEKPRGGHTYENEWTFQKNGDEEEDSNAGSEYHENSGLRGAASVETRPTNAVYYNVNVDTPQNGRPVPIPRPHNSAPHPAIPPSVTQLSSVSLLKTPGPVLMEKTQNPDINKFLKGIALPQYTDIFMKKGWMRVDQLAELSTNDFREAGVNPSHIFKIMSSRPKA